MKIVVIGGIGLIGRKLVNKLGQKGHEVMAASPSSGINTVPGEALAGALRHRVERSKPHPRRWPAHPQDAFRGPAQPFPTSGVSRPDRMNAPIV